MTATSYLRRAALAFGVSLLLLGHATAGGNAPIVVNTTNDSAGAGGGVLSLRDAILLANSQAGDDTITFDTTVFAPANGPYTIQLTGVLPDLSSNITINGPGANVLAVRGQGDSFSGPPYPYYRIFNVAVGQTVNLSGLTISNGKAAGTDGAAGAAAPPTAGAPGMGGGILNAGTLSVTDCLFSGDTAQGGAGGVGGFNKSQDGMAGADGFGGAIYSSGSLSVVRCAFVGNAARGGSGGSGSNQDFGTLGNGAAAGSAWGGAIYLAAGATNSVVDSTFANNGASGGFGGSGGSHSSGPIGTGAKGGDSHGGAIYTTQPLTLTSCTVVQGNSTAGRGGYTSSGNFNLYAASGLAEAGGLQAVGAITIGNSLVAANLKTTQPTNDAGSPVTVESDVLGTFLSQNFNLIAGLDASATGFTGAADQTGTIAAPIDAKLDPQGAVNNGGPTPTVRLRKGSPAVDKGKDLGPLVKDQRGNVRPKDIDDLHYPNAAGGDGSDIGAYESQSLPNDVPVVQSPQSVAGAVGTALANQMVTGTDGDNDPLTFSIVTGTMPDGLTLHSDGTITGTPMTPGTSSITFKANDTIDDSNVATLNFSIVEAGSAVVNTDIDNSTNTDGLTSLREAINYASSHGGTVTFDPTFFATAKTIVLTAAVQATNSLTVTGPAAGVTLSGGDTTEIMLCYNFNFDNTTPVTVKVSGITFAHGHANGTGGALYFNNFGSPLNVTLANCTLNNNGGTDTQGGAISNSGATLNLINCTLAGNFADNMSGTASAGGAIYNASGQVTLNDCTVSGNSSNGGKGGGIAVIAPGTVSLRNTLVAGNTAATGPNISGAVVAASSYNLIGDGTGLTGISNGAQGNQIGTTASPIDPKLDPAGLAANGGPTATIKLLAGSPAIDAGDPSFNPSAFTPPVTTDQRGPGYTRVGRGNPASPTLLLDIGAFELVQVPTFAHSMLTVGSGGGMIDLATATSPSPTGGTFSGTGVSNGVFNPSGLAPGPYAITYTSPDGGIATVTVTIPAPPIVVDENSDVDDGNTTPGHVSLREALRLANTQAGPDIIMLPAGVITLTSALPPITQDTMIVGAAGGTTVSGAGQFQVFNVTGGNVSFAGLTIANGKGTQGASGGAGGTAGGLQIGGTANVTVTNALFIGNTGGAGDSANGDPNQGRGAGGGLQTNSSGTVTIRNCTFYGNQGGAGGGEGRGGAGGVQFENGTVLFQSNTVAGNTGGNTGGSGGGGTGGAFTINQSPTVTNSLFADNIAGTGATFGGGVDFGGTMSSGGYNLLQSTYGTDTAALQASDLRNVNAGLDAGGPQDHGGPTKTIRLGADSKALDAGKAPAGGSTDQRGQPRPVDLADATYPNAAGGDGSDIGAYELQNAPILVTSTGDTPTPGVLTLREAIAQAESQPGDDTIVFSFPGTGVHTIPLGSALPNITQPLLIDGYSQPGAKANTLAIGSNAVVLIELQGPGIGTFNGLNITGTGSTIRGLSIGGFEWGIGLVGAGNTVSGNYVGLHADGVTSFNNNYGVVAFPGPNSIIGATSPADRNVISSNNTDGVYLDAGATGTVVRGNYIGTNAAGTAALGNGRHGILLAGAGRVTVGGTAPGAGNLVSGNFFHGIRVDNGATGDTVQGNRIGTDATGTTGIANQYGVVFSASSSSNLVGGTAAGAANLIAYNTANGVYVENTSAGDAIRGNRIYANGLTGILLSDGSDSNVTANDDGDADTGANNQQNYPVITSVSVAGGNLTIGGTFNSTASTTFALDFFVNDAPDASGYGGGQTYLGTGSVTTAGNNNGAFSVTLPGVTISEETYVTATATDPDGNTSVFSVAQVFFTGTIQTGPSFVVNTTADSNKLPTTSECSLREAITAANAFNGACTITFDPTVFATAQTITLTRGELQITNAITITGPAAGVTVDGHNASRVFTIDGGTTSMSGLTVTDGNGVGSIGSGRGGGILLNSGNLTLLGCTVTNNTLSNDSGGGIRNEGSGTLIITNCAITNNSAKDSSGILNNNGTLHLTGSTVANNTATGPVGAGGILNNATMTMTNCTVSGNHADGATASYTGGGVYSAGTATITNCTFTGNTASGMNSAGGLRCDGGAATVSNTIIAGNTGTNGATADLNNTDGGIFTSKGYNLIGDGTGATGFTNGTLADQVGTTANPIDPRLGPLANNGGPTLTHAPLTTPVVSPAIDAGNSGLDTDQRGLARGFDNPAAANGSGNLSDIGAVELGSTVTPVLQTGPNFVVNTTGDDDDLPTTTNTSLREAIKAANGLAAGTATITFDPTVFATAQTITLSGSDLVIQHAMTIVGPGADKLTISGNNQSRIFTVNTADGLNTISGLTVTGGNGQGYVFGALGGGICNIGELKLQDCAVTGNTAGSGGGVHTHTSATLTLLRCTISNNTATSSFGGGVNSFLNATLTSCTISGNHSDHGAGGDNAGGVWSARGALAITNCTITNNTAAGTNGAGGVRSGSLGGSQGLTVGNTIIAGNTGTSGATADMNNASGGAITSGGFNLIGDGSGVTATAATGDQIGTTAHPIDPRLGPLADHGGPTPTHALLAFSPAIDKGKVLDGSTTDQRGQTRPVDLANADYPNATGGDGSDIGAYEAQVEPPLPPYAGVDDAVAVTTHSVTRIYPLANDVSPSGDPLRLVSVSNPAIVIDGRSLIIPAGFTGSFTYTFTDGAILGQATVTVTAGATVTTARTYAGLLLDPNGTISGSVNATFTGSGRIATLRLISGTGALRAALSFPAGATTASQVTALGMLSLTRNADGTATAQLSTPGGPIGGVLQPRKASTVPARYNAALASIDAAIPGGGYAFLNTYRSSAAAVVGRLPDGKVFSTSTSLRDDGTVAFYALVRAGVNPPETVGGELVLFDLAATDFTGELAWTKPTQHAGIRGLHLDGVDTVLTVNGCQFKRQPLPAGNNVLTLSGGNLIADEQTTVPVTAGRPHAPTGSLKSWQAYRNFGIFRTRVKLPGRALPVSGAGVYLPKSDSAWGFFPGLEVGGRIELTPPAM